MMFAKFPQKKRGYISNVACTNLLFLFFHHYSSVKQQYHSTKKSENVFSDFICIIRIFVPEFRLLLQPCVTRRCLLAAVLL